MPTRTDAADDEFLFRRAPPAACRRFGSTTGERCTTQFADLPNVAVFVEQAEHLTELIRNQAPTAAQAADLDLALTLAELFTLVVYGQLILEQAEIVGLDRDVIDEIFAVLIRDFSSRAVELHGKAGSPRRSRHGRSMPFAGR